MFHRLRDFCCAYIKDNISVSELLYIYILYIHYIYIYIYI